MSKNNTQKIIFLICPRIRGAIFGDTIATQIQEQTKILARGYRHQLQADQRMGTVCVTRLRAGRSLYAWAVTVKEH
jgi:hypothetical protein